MKKPLTLCIVLREGKVLLGMKKRGFGVGKWNGFGGKLDEGESIEQAALRELEEEVGIVAQALEPAGTITFSFESEPLLLEVHIFKVEQFIGEPVETEEMRPQWFEPAAIPYADMWADDEYWLPLLLSGKTFSGSFHFDAPASLTHNAKILKNELVAN